MLQNLINHITFVIDASGSMYSLSKKLVEVFDKEIESLKKRSVELDQETRLSIYTFNGKLKNLLFDMDVMRMKSLKSYYNVEGNTALVDSVISVISDLNKIPELYGDHANLIYVLTDGEDNVSVNIGYKLNLIISQLPVNYTTVCLVPNARALFEVKKLGFPSNNCAIWDTTVKGMEEVGKQFNSSIDNYFHIRSKGIKSTNNFFQLDTTKLTTTIINNDNLDKISDVDYNKYFVDHHKHGSQIRDFIIERLGYYDKGNSYYELTKPEIVQDYKKLLILDKSSQVLFGGDNVRSILGLPNTTVKVNPASTPRYTIFVQSTSVNRKVVYGTSIITLH